MVRDNEPARARYVAGTEGAPPVPPPGGYRNARRPSTPAGPVYGAPAVSTATLDTEAKPSSPLGWISLVAGILFAVILLIIFLAGGTDLLYGVTMLALQLVVAAVAIGALFIPGARRLATVAVAIALVFNVATVGGLSALQTSATGNYDGQKTEEQRHAAAYPGIKDVSSRDVLAQQSLEEVRSTSEVIFADIRSRLTAEFGVDWVQVGTEDLRPERNGYGGESMLVEYTAAGWATTEPIHDYATKLAMMDVIEDVVFRHQMSYLYSFNDEYSGLDPTVIEKMYGSTDARTQHTWEYYAENYPEPMRFYANIYDLSNDSTGEFLKNRQAQQSRSGEPLEGLQITVIASALLSEADRAEFEEKLGDYPGYD